jgi:hypothetical protein
MKKQQSWYKELKQMSPGNHFWTRGAKLNVAFALIIVSILLGSYLGSAVTRHITPTGDDIETFIRNSKGGQWTPTGANLQLAINDLTTGLVTVGSNIALTTQITGKSGVTIDFTGHTITPATSFDMILMKPDFKIKNVVFDVSGISYTNNVITYDGADHFTCINHSTGLEDVTIKNAYLSRKGTGILMTTDADGEYITFTKNNKIGLQYLEYGIRLRDTTATMGGLPGFINANHFSDLFMQGCQYGIYITRSDGKIDENMFTNFDISCDAIGENGSIIGGNGTYLQGNYWDYGTDIALNITSDAYNTIYIGYGTENCYIDNGTESMLWKMDAGNFTMPWINLWRIFPYQGQTELRLYDEAKNNSYLDIFRDATGTPYLRFWGYSSGDASTRKLNLHIDYNNGDGVFTSDDNIEFYPGGGQVGIYGKAFIDDILQLHPRTTTPTAPSEGYIYYNGTTHLAYCYNGSAWNALW